MTLHRFVLSAGCCAALALGEPARAEDAPQPPADSIAAAATAPSAADAVLAERPEALRGLSRVAITTFSVEFMTFLEARVEGDWTNLIGNKPNDVSVKMVGHDPSGWQAVADGLYDRLVADLVAAGIEVVPQERLRALPEYAPIAKAAAALPKELSGRAGRGTYYAARDLPVVIQDEASVFRQAFKVQFGKKAPEDLYMGTGTKIASSFSAGAVLHAEHQVAKALGAHVLKVRMTVLPTQVTANQDFWAGGSVDTKAAVSLVPFVNRYLFYAPDGKDARLSIREDLVSERAAGELKDVTSGLSKANQVAGVGIRVLGALGGLSTPGAIGKTQDFEFAVDNAVYPSVVSDTLATAHRLFFERLQVARAAAP